MAVLEGHAHIQGIITIIDQGDFALNSHRAMGIVIGQAEYANATLDATVGENLFVTPDGSDVDTLLDQRGIDLKFSRGWVLQHGFKATETTGGQSTPFDTTGGSLLKAPVDVEAVDCG